MSKKKIVFFVSTDRYFITHRLNLAVSAVEMNYEVYLITTVTSEEYLDKIKINNIKVVDLKLNRSGKNPITELLFFIKLLNRIRSIKPDIIHNVAMKPVIYGSIISKIVKTKKTVNAIAGTGIVFSKKSISNIFVKQILKLLLFLSLHNSKIIVQNKSDKDFVMKLGLNEKSIRLQNGVGVNIMEYKKNKKKLVSLNVLLASRLLWSKGVGDYINAIKIIKKTRKDITFCLAGITDNENPDKIPNDQILLWEKEGLIKYLGWVENMHEVLSQTKIFCLPSFYGEGMPKSLIEASASGIPSITTNTPGCNEIVTDNHNGFLVPINSPESIAKKILSLIDNKRLYEIMSENCLKTAKENFDENKIISETLKLYE